MISNLKYNENPMTDIQIAKNNNNVEFILQKSIFY